MDAQGADGRDVTTDTEDLSYLSTLDWFPDGARLAITAKRGIEIADVESGTRTTLIDGFATKAIDVSSDGKRVVFGINRQKHLTGVEGLKAPTTSKNVTLTASPGGLARPANRRRSGNNRYYERAVGL